MGIDAGDVPLQSQALDSHRGAEVGHQRAVGQFTGDVDREPVNDLLPVSFPVARAGLSQHDRQSGVVRRTAGPQVTENQV